MWKPPISWQTLQRPTPPPPRSGADLGVKGAFPAHLDPPCRHWKYLKTFHLHCIYWWLVTDVAAQPMGPIFYGQANQECWLTREDGTDRLCRNVCNYSSTLLKDLIHTAAEA
jgi:hypothetical protein